MLRPRFFTARALPDHAATLTLEAEPARHIARTLRMRVGDRLCLFDGSGRECGASIELVERNSVAVHCEAATAVSRESPLRVTLAIAVSRGERMDTVIQKATELGVAEIWPLLSERVGVKLDEARWARKTGHWQRVAISACEQSGRNVVPTVAAPESLARILERSADCELRLLLHPAAEAGELPAQCRSLCLLVGPEGGFSDAEVEAAVDAGAQSLVLGPRVLRTETAPLAALTMAQLRWGDF